MVGRSIFLVLLATRVFADAPVARIADVRHAAPGGETIIVRGTVTMVPGTMPTEPDSFYIQDASGAISVHAPSHLKLSPTQEVEVEGTIHAIQENEPEVQATRVTVLRRVPRILPRSASVEQVLSADFEAQLLRIRGTVAKAAIGDARDDIYVQVGPRLLRCYLRHNPLRPSILITQAPVGAEVEVTGLALPSPGEGHALRMRDSVDLALIRRPYMLTTGMLVGLGVAGVIALLVVAWNLTLRRSIRSQTREIRALLTKAEEASQLKSEFLANLSHEIRTPIHAVQGMHALLAESNLSPDQQEELAIAQESTRHLLALLDDVIDLARIESGRMVLESLPIDPAALLHRILRSFEPSAQRKGLTVECRMGDLPAGLTGDPTRLRQVLFNLLNNAIKFTDRGRITAEAWAAESTNAQVRVGFRVRDTGIGIAEDKQKIIFESFRQVDGTISRRYGGSGLGLAITRRLVRQMGGDVTVQSVEGEGSTFEFSVVFGRANVVPSSAPEPQQERQPASQNPLHVLVAEDNEVNQRLVLRMLERDGHQVTVVNNGAAAVEACRDRHFDVVLMDVQMPGMDGLQAAVAIREQERQGAARRRPIYALTAHSLAGDRDRCLSAGMDDCLTKPFLLDDLRALLAGVTSLKS